MKKIFTIIGLFGFFAASAEPTDTLSLFLCHQEALTNYPLLKQKQLLLDNSELQIQKLNANYLPQLNINGQATYQSEVTSIDIPSQTIPVSISSLPVPFPIPPISIKIPDLNVSQVNYDMYKLTLDVNQIIYDGGLTSRQKKLEEANYLINQQNVDIELYKVKDRVSDLYFNIVLLKKNKLILESIREDIVLKHKRIESAVENGAALRSNADILQAEIMKIDQQIIGLVINIHACYSMLEDLILNNVSDTTVFLLPEVTVLLDSTKYNHDRLEYGLLTLQQQKVDVMKKLSASKRHPKLFGFGQMGYGRPGLNMLSTDFNSFYIVGAQLTWTPWDWNQVKDEKKQLAIQDDILSTQKETFNKNLRIALEGNLADIYKFEALIKKDKAIIELRADITKASSSQLDEGIITSSEFLTELYAENQARLNLETHKIQLIQSKIKYLTSLGKL